MRKLLSILSALGLVATASTSVTACSIGKNVDESIAPALEEQNYKAVQWLGAKENQGKSVLDYIKETSSVKDDANIAESLLYSNGLTGDNKYLDANTFSNSLTGSFNSNKWSFLSMLNSKFNLGMKADTTIQKHDDLQGGIKASELVGYVKPSISNLSSLSNIEVGSSTDSKGKLIPAVEASSQADGKPPVGNSEASIERFDDWLSLGSSSNGQSYDWKKDKALLLGETFDGHEYKGEWQDATITKKTNFVYKDGNTTKKNFIFTQIIRLTNTKVLKNYLFGEDGKSGEAAALKKYYDANFSKQSVFTYDDFMNMIFEKLNIFTAVKQQYSVSVDTDCNYLVSQIRDTVSNMTDVVNNQINSNNESIIASALISGNNGSGLRNSGDTNLSYAEFTNYNEITVHGWNMINDAPNKNNINISGVPALRETDIKSIDNQSDGSFKITFNQDFNSYNLLSDGGKTLKITYTSILGKTYPVELNIPKSEDYVVNKDAGTVDLSKIDSSWFSKYALCPRIGEDKATAKERIESSAYAAINDLIKSESYVSGDPIGPKMLIGADDVDAVINSSEEKLTENDQVQIVSAKTPWVDPLSTLSQDDSKGVWVVEANVRNIPDGEINIKGFPKGWNITSSSVSKNKLRIEFKTDPKNPIMNKSIKDQKITYSFYSNDVELKSSFSIPSAIIRLNSSEIGNANDEQGSLIVVGTVNLKFDKNNLEVAQGLNSNGIIVDAAKNKALSKNDFLNTTLGIKDNDGLSSFLKYSYIESDKSSYVENSALKQIRDKVVAKKDIDSALSQISKNFENVVYTDKLNKKMPDTLELKIYYSDENYNEKSFALTINKSLII